MNIENGAIKTEELTEFPSVPYTLDSGVVVKEMASIKSYMMHENDLPYEWDYEIPNLVYDADDMHESFTFVTKNNQYTNVKCVH